jgi:hypothetical protein
VRETWHRFRTSQFRKLFLTFATQLANLRF